MCTGKHFSGATAVFEALVYTYTVRRAMIIE